MVSRSRVESGILECWKDEMMKEAGTHRSPEYSIIPILHRSIIPAEPHRAPLGKSGGQADEPDRLQ